MGSDQKTSSENGRIYYFDNRKEDKDEMERVKPLLDLDLWAREFGTEELDDLEKSWLLRVSMAMIPTSSQIALLNASKIMAFPKTNP